MNELPVLVLLSSAVVLLCSAAPALEPVTCNGDSGAAAARLATFHINEHHDHGYKFRLIESQGNKVEKVGNGCNIELQLNLLETTCHVVNPKHFEDCEIRQEHAMAVRANCSVLMTVKNSEAKVTKYECGTQQANTDMDMMMMCPDCPKLIPLNSPEGLKSVHESMKIANQNTSCQHHYVLQEVGRITSGYIMMAGMFYYAEFALVETHCLMGTKIIPETCIPLCPDRAHHALCRSTYSNTNGLSATECEFYPPSNTTPLGPGEEEPVCRAFHHPPHPHGAPPHAGSGGPPPHGQGPPHGQERLEHGTPFNVFHPLQPFHSCHGFQTNSDPALHPICPWPHPEPHPNPNQSQS
ncbi:alpha-2-HS-glycoprotein 1 [Enoplosus armatus]|uniref:alpha-2-HS-glycoprotein 1 n=1 Tax=Enoplosus armatus TaxID=215367 RepID=UPI0039965063